MDLTPILVQATSEIEERYFKLRIDGGKSVYRERIYCYELYHQMREKWPQTPYVLNGEVDKSGHPSPLGGTRLKPDLLVHGPGDMRENYAVIEVKHSNAEIRGIRKDLETLSFFITHGGYRHPIILIYGDKAFSVARKTAILAKDFKLLDNLEIWIHERARSPAQRFVYAGEDDEINAPS